MTPREVVLNQIEHRETAEVPYTLPIEPPVAERLDEHFGSNEWRQRIVPYMAHCGVATAAPTERLDESHNRDVFGTVRRTDELPSAVVEPGLKQPSFEGYAFPTADAFRNAEVKEATRKRVEETTDSFTIVAAGMCLWNSWYLRGFEQTLIDCITEPEFYEALLERITVLTLDLLEECADIPADGVMMGDDWGDQRGIILGPERWRELVKPRYKRIFDAIHDQGKFAIMHCCGSAADVMGDVIEIGLDVIESVQPEAAGMNPYALKAKWGDQITFWGGLGSQSTIPFGTPDEIRDEIRRLRREMSKGGGYILAPAKPVRTETPTENAVAVFEEFVEGQ